ncbi:MAG: leucine-rich repeat domain-containing protein [Holosporales bacterium]|nr:leucine-rich repeat domain-containing protein [Holosporales bacterium]
MLAGNVNGVGEAFNNATSYIRRNMVLWGFVFDYPEFVDYLGDRRKTVVDLQSQENTLVLVGQSSVPTGTVLGDIKELYLVGNWSPTGLDIAGCTGLVTLGMFDGGVGLDSDQRSKISSLVKGQKKLQNLIVMNWGGVEIAEGAFGSTSASNSAKSLVKVIINKAISIQNEAFSRCENLITVSIPDAVTIGILSGSAYGPFEYCINLKTASFPVAESIGNYAFYGCNALQAASFPVAKEIGSYAFNCCYALQAASFPIAEEIGVQAFYCCSALQAASFPAAESIGDKAFRYCTALQAASFPAATSISDYAFRNCPALQEITYPQGASIDKRYAFYGCTQTIRILNPNGSLRETYNG